jgi:signal transduction histidine kinase
VNLPIMTIRLVHEQDVVIARRRARQIAALLRFEPQDQARIATAVSEIARNAIAYAGGGSVEFLVERAKSGDIFSIRISDSGPGISELHAILSGTYQSKTGMGAGILGAKRLMDRLEIDSRVGQGTVVLLSKILPAHAGPLTADTLAALSQRLGEEPQDFFEEVRSQNHDLLVALEEVRTTNVALEERQDDLERLNRELEETNRGVVALYAELDERAERLRTADAMKSRFLSYMSHEFRTPLNGIVGLTRLLLDRPSIHTDPEAGKQVRFVQDAAEELTELVNDLLDLAKAEAGKLTVHPVDFEAEAVLGAVRGVFRALTSGGAVSLNFDTILDCPRLNTDETKLAQIIRNFVSNALKFTESGEVRVSVIYNEERDAVTFSVSDTGIGIAPQFHSLIFDEFSQIEHPIQKKNKGTGLGLPLCKRLAELLGGTVAVTSTPGEGSVFSVTIPRVYGTPQRHAKRKILIIDDEEISRYLLRALIPSEYEVTEADGGDQGLRLARAHHPDLIFLDLKMPDVSGVEVLRELQKDAATQDIPVVIATSYDVGEIERAGLERSVVTILRKDVLARAEGLAIDFGHTLSVTARPKQGILVQEAR